MNEEPIEFRLPNMGADFGSEEELMDFLNDTDGTVSRNEVHSSRGNYLTAETEDGMQIWFQPDAEDRNCINHYNIHFKSPVRTKLRLDGWTGQESNGLFGLACMWNEAGDVEFPLNIDIVDSGLFADYESGEFTAQVAAFGYHVDLFPDLDALVAANTGYAPESCIPVGTLPINREPCADTIMSGKILSARRAVNAYTGGTYYHLCVDCIGMRFDALLREEDTPSEPVVGGYIHGYFYLTARLFPSEGDAGLTPIFSARIEDLIDDFPPMAFREDVPNEPYNGWELLATPVMPDKGFLAIFQNTTGVEEGEEENSPFFYRFLRYDSNGSLVESRRTRINGGAVTTAYYDSADHLHIVFCRIRDEITYVFDLDDGQEDHPIHPLGEDISRLITDSNGNIFVGRDYSAYLYGANELVCVYDAGGEKKTALDVGNNYRCAELLLDEQERVWYLTEPVLSLRQIDTKEDACRLKSGIPLARVLAMAISADGDRMFCECEGMRERGRFFTLSRKDGQFVNPESLFPPLLIQEFSERHGQCATAKDRVVFLTDDSLFFFRLEGTKCNTLEDLSKVRILNRATGKARFYQIEIDPAVPVAEGDLDKYVRPILEKMLDVPGESLTIAYRNARASDSLGFIQAAKDGEAFHLEIGINNSDRYPANIYALLSADLETTYRSFKTVIVDRECPDLSTWTDYTETVFGKKDP